MTVLTRSAASAPRIPPIIPPASTADEERRRRRSARTMAQARSRPALAAAQPRSPKGERLTAIAAAMAARQDRKSQAFQLREEWEFRARLRAKRSSEELEGCDPGVSGNVRLLFSAWTCDDNLTVQRVTYRTMNFVSELPDALRMVLHCKSKHAIGRRRGPAVRDSPCLYILLPQLMVNMS